MAIITRSAAYCLTALIIPVWLLPLDSCNRGGLVRHAGLMSSLAGQIKAGSVSAWALQSKQIFEVLFTRRGFETAGKF